MERPIVIDERRQEVVQELMRNVYMWMTGGLALTGVIAWIVANSPAILSFIYGSSVVVYGLLIGELVLVIGLSMFRGVLLIHKFECKPFRKSRSFGISRPS